MVLKRSRHRKNIKTATKSGSCDTDIEKNDKRNYGRISARIPAAGHPAAGRPMSFTAKSGNSYGFGNLFHREWRHTLVRACLGNNWSCKIATGIGNRRGIPRLLQGQGDGTRRQNHLNNRFGYRHFLSVIFFVLFFHNPLSLFRPWVEMA